MVLLHTIYRELEGFHPGHCRAGDSHQPVEFSQIATDSHAESLRLGQSLFSPSGELRSRFPLPKVGIFSFGLHFPKIQ